MKGKLRCRGQQYQWRLCFYHVAPISYTMKYHHLELWLKLIGIHILALIPLASLSDAYQNAQNILGILHLRWSPNDLSTIQLSHWTWSGVRIIPRILIASPKSCEYREEPRLTTSVLAFESFAFPYHVSACIAAAQIRLWLFASLQETSPSSTNCVSPFFYLNPTLPRLFHQVNYTGYVDFDFPAACRFSKDTTPWYVHVIHCALPTRRMLFPATPRSPLTSCFSLYFPYFLQDFHIPILSPPVSISFISLPHFHTLPNLTPFSFYISNYLPTSRYTVKLHKHSWPKSC